MLWCTIFVYCTCIELQEESTSPLQAAIDYRESIQQLTLEMELHIGGEELERSRRLSYWTDRRRMTHRLDIVTEGHPREVYGFQCEFPSKYFSYYEYNPSGTIVAGFDLDKEEGVSAKRFLFDPRSIGASWKPTFFCGNDVRKLYENSSVHSTSAVSDSLIDEMRSLGYHDSESNLLAVSFLDGNIQDVVVVDLRTGPSVVFCKHTLQQPKEYGGGEFIDRSLSTMHEWSPDLWFPKVVQFITTVDGNVQHREEIRITSCSFDEIDDSVFTLKGIAIQPNTLISGADGDRQWMRWDSESASLVADASDVDIDSSPEPQVGNKWLLLLNVAGAAGLVAILYFARRRN